MPLSNNPVQSFLQGRVIRTACSVSPELCNWESYSPRICCPVQCERTHIVLGSKAGRNGPEVEGKEDDTRELYKKAYSSLQTAQSLSGTAEKVAAVKQSLASASEEVQQDPQHQTSLVALGSLQGKASQEREQWQQTLEGFQASLEKASDNEVEKALQDVQDTKQECDRQQEKLSKEFGPRKLWAKKKCLLK